MKHTNYGISYAGHKHQPPEVYVNAYIEYVKSKWMEGGYCILLPLIIEELHDKS